MLTFNLNTITNYTFKIFNTVKNGSVIGKKNKVRSTLIFHSRIGNYNYIGPGVIINNSLLGNYCSIAAYTQIGGMEHDYSKFSTSTFLNKGIKHEKVVIGDDVWIGAGVYIKAGVNIGKGAVIGAGAIVLENIPEYAIVVGVPAKVIKYRFSNFAKEFHSRIDFSKDFNQLKKINEDFNSRR